MQTGAGRRSDTRGEGQRRGGFGIRTLLSEPVEAVVVSWSPVQITAVEEACVNRSATIRYCTELN